MITGRRPFGGRRVTGSSHAAANDDREDVASVLAAVIQSEPRWDSVPARLRPLLESCLQKDPRMRLRDIGDAWKLWTPRRRGRCPLEAVRSDRSRLACWRSSRRLRSGLPWRGESSPALREPMRFKVDAGTDVVLPPLSAPTFSSVVISPDGTRLVYVGSVRGGPPKLLTRRLDQAEFSELVGTEGASNPFFSRDSQWVGFWNAGALFKVPVESGGATKLADMPAMGRRRLDRSRRPDRRGPVTARRACCGFLRRARPPHSWNWPTASGFIRIRESCRAASTF